MPRRCRVDSAMSKRLLERRIDGDDLTGDCAKVRANDIGSWRERVQHLARARDERRGASRLHRSDNVPRMRRDQAKLIGLNAQFLRDKAVRFRRWLEPSNAVNG